MRVFLAAIAVAAALVAPALSRAEGLGCCAELLPGRSSCSDPSCAVACWSLPADGQGQCLNGAEEGKPRQWNSGSCWGLTECAGKAATGCCLRTLQDGTKVCYATPSEFHCIVVLGVALGTAGDQSYSPQRCDQPPNKDACAGHLEDPNLYGGQASPEEAGGLRINLTPPEPAIPTLAVAIPGLAPFTKPGGSFEQGYVIPYIGQYLSAIYAWALALVVTLAVAMTVWGGVKWLTAGGDQSRVSSAKTTIVNALAGLLLALGTYLILNTLNPQILKFQALHIDVVERGLEPLDSERQAAFRQFENTPRSGGAPTTGGASSGGTPSGQTQPSGGQATISPESSPGCQDGPAVTVNLDWRPAGQSAAFWPTGQSKILVPGKALNCPGAYPVIIWLHGNNKDGKTSGKIKDFEKLLNDLVGQGVSQPVIIVMPTSKGQTTQLYPGLKLTELRDAALDALRNNQTTNGISFSTVSVGGHSGIGCNELWGRVQEIEPYAILNSDTCFNKNVATHNPEKMVIGVANMSSNYKGESPPGYVVVMRTLGLESVAEENCPTLFPLTGETPNCAKHPTKDWRLFFFRDRNHGKAGAKVMEYALRNFFAAK